MPEEIHPPKGNAQPQVSRPTPKPGPKSSPSAKTAKARISLDKNDATKILSRIKEEVDDHRACVDGLKTKLEKLTHTAFTELLKVKELKNIVEKLKEKPEKEERSSSREQPQETWKKELDRELEKLLIIKKLLEDSLPNAAPQEPPPPLLSPNGQKKILVVDDDPTTVKIIQHFLVKENYTVSTSLSGVEGLKKAFQENPDLIILDIMMPDLDGFQFLSIFRKDAEYARTPVVILSSLAEEADVLKGLEIGAADYITKPFSPPVLLAKIKKSLNSQP